MNERIASEIEMMSQEGLIYLQDHFEKDLDNFFLDNKCTQLKRLQRSADKVQCVKEICQHNILTFLLLENLGADTTKIIRGKIDELCNLKAKQAPQKPLIDSILEDISQQQLKPIVDRQQIIEGQSPTSCRPNPANQQSTDFSNMFFSAYSGTARDVAQVSHFGSIVTPKRKAYP